MERERRRFSAIPAETLALAVLLLLTWVELGRLHAAVSGLETSVAQLRSTVDKRHAEAAWPVSPLLLDYQLDLPGRGEVFPAMWATPVPEYWPVAVLRVTNTADRAVAQTIQAEIAGWSLRSEQSLVLAARETRNVSIQPALLPGAYENAEIRRATLEVRVLGPDAGLLFVESRTVLIHGGSDIYWGRRFVNAQIAARWVTPHDPAVLELIAQARKYAARGRLGGYNGPPGPGLEAQVRAQSRAIFRALQHAGISYVSSLFVMGEHVGHAQRIRLPAETLRVASANCMDVSVVFAAAAENVGLEPLLIIVPGHALVGVRLQRGSQRVLYLDLTVLPDGSFEAAEARARAWMRKTPSGKVLAVDVAATRVLGLYPLPRGPLA